MQRSYATNMRSDHVSDDFSTHLSAFVDDLRQRADAIPEPELGAALVALRRTIDSLESVSVEVLRRFDKSREYVSDGSASSVAWMRHNCRISAASAAQRLEMARNLPELPETEAAFAKGEIGYQHVSLISKTAEQVGVAAVREAESILVKAAKEMGPGRFRIVIAHLRHALDPDGALEDANQSFERRYLHLSESLDGVYYLDGRLDPEGGAALATALDALMKPLPQEERRARQRRADALVELGRRALNSGRLPEVGGQRPHVNVSAGLETLAAALGQPGGDLEWGCPVPAETVRRLACDCALTMIVLDKDGKPLDVGRRSRTITPQQRRALAHRDKHCRFPGCDRPVAWTDGHHVKHWIDGGETNLPNLCLVCGLHHRRVHEEGWRLAWGEEGEIVAIPPERYRQKLKPVAALALDLAAG